MEYKTIYADPPWAQKAGRALNKYTLQNGKQIWSSSDNNSRELSFSSMTVSEIMALALPVGANAHLYMWATNKYLPDAFRIGKAWGFDYSTTIVWAKNMSGGGLGGAFRINTEFLIFFRKGTLQSTGSIKGTWFNVKRDYTNGYPQHSRKPELFRGIIEKVSPGPYLELFARRRVAGWDAFGDQLT